MRLIATLPILQINFLSYNQNSCSLLKEKSAGGYPLWQESHECFSFLISDRRANSNAFLFALLRDGVERLSYSFQFLPLCQFISGSAFLKKLLCFHPTPSTTTTTPNQDRVLFPFQLNLFLFLRIASHSWLTVDQHPHIGTRE